MTNLIEDVFVTNFDNAELALVEDQARIDLSSLTAIGDRLALTTDSFVVSPIFFNGGDIGKLAVSFKVFLQFAPDVNCMRDATRAGIAAVSNEFATSSGVTQIC